MFVGRKGKIAPRVLKIVFTKVPPGSGHPARVREAFLGLEMPTIGQYIDVCVPLKPGSNPGSLENIGGYLVEAPIVFAALAAANKHRARRWLMASTQFGPGDYFIFSRAVCTEKY